MSDSQLFPQEFWEDRPATDEDVAAAQRHQEILAAIQVLHERIATLAEAIDELKPKRPDPSIFGPTLAGNR